MLSFCVYYQFRSVKMKVLVIFLLALVIAGKYNSGTAESVCGRGLVMSDPINISNTPITYSQLVDVSVGDGGAINIVWEENGGISFSRSVDGGNTFIAPVIVEPIGSSYSLSQAKVVEINGNIHITFTVFGYSGTAEIIYTRSTNGGKTFSPLLVVSDIDGYNSTSPNIAAYGSSFIGIVWSDGWFGAANFSYSTDNGDTFSKPIGISNSGGGPDIDISS